VPKQNYLPTPIFALLAAQGFRLTWCVINFVYLLSNFWLGLYGDIWIITKEFVEQWVEELMRLNPNKLSFYYRGLRAMTIIQQTF
jgi:hypothetical protein